MLGASINQSIWNSRFFEQGGLFDVFKPWAEWFLLQSAAFPSLDSLTRASHECAVAPPLSGGGFPIRFVRQQRVMRQQRLDLGWRANYQLRIFFSGEVPSRTENWHDFFNAWTWIFLPRVKSAINKRHFYCLDETIEFPWRLQGGNRNREQDMLTLFDEGGLLVVTDDDELWQLVVERRWMSLFVEQSERVYAKMMFIPVGHALFECALNGHPHLHASCIRVTANVAQQLKRSDGGCSLETLKLIDERAALEIERRTHLRSPDDLHAFPIWGLRGWHPQAGDPSFISDKTHFR